ncbi:MAG: DUF6475 domain-containing protein [Lutibacter sp.]|jgi:hypothetical protein
MTQDFYILHFGLLLKYLGLKPDNEKSALYWNFLKHMDDDTFKLSVQEIIKNFVPTVACPFPLVSHFLKYCGSDAQGEATKAISTLRAYARRIGRMDSVNFNDSALHETIIRFGGWVAICDFTDKDWNINEGRLMDVYKTMQQSFCADIHHLPGVSEKSNGGYRIYDVSKETMQITGHSRILSGALIETKGTVRPLLQFKRQELLEDNSEHFDMDKYFESASKLFDVNN